MESSLEWQQTAPFLKEAKELEQVRVHNSIWYGIYT
jgi:hypothetical protein